MSTSRSDAGGCLAVVSVTVARPPNHHSPELIVAGLRGGPWV